MSTARYERIPTDAQRAGEDTDIDRPLRASVQAEFNRPPPPWWKRGLLLLALVALGWLSMKLATGNQKPQVIYATRFVPHFTLTCPGTPHILSCLEKV
jgi:hypothetical protein